MNRQGTGSTEAGWYHPREHREPHPSREPVNEKRNIEHASVDDREVSSLRSSVRCGQRRVISTWRRRAADLFSAILPQRYQRLPEQTMELSTQLQRLTTQVAEQRSAMDSGYQRLLELLAEVSRLRGEDRAELTSVAARMQTRTEAMPAPPRVSRREDATAVGQPDIDSFYSGFEERFRGSRERIREKMVEYLPVIKAVDRGDAPVLDVGPGRCEWLDLLRSEAIRAYGVDTNARFVELGESLGLDVKLGDAIEHLRGLPDASLAGVTGFQVAEHLPTGLLFELVDNALRTLRPGGVLILETPNPLNLTIGAAEFWIDPTHLRPLHPQLLEYLLINRGFVDVEVRTTNAPEGSFDLGRLGKDGSELRRLGGRLNDLLYTGGDFAVIGHRAASAS